MNPTSSEISFDISACLKRVRKRDQDAAKELVEHLFPLVMRIVRGRLPRRESAEDLAQEVFLKMFARLDQYRGEVPFPHWVSRIAVTTCIDHLRVQQRRPEFRWADLSEEESGAMQAALAYGDEVGAPDSLAARELVDRLLAQLRPDDRLVIQMLDMEQKPMAAVSALTGWNIQVVKTRAFRARKRLQAMFRQLERDEDEAMGAGAFALAAAGA